MSLDLKLSGDDMLFIDVDAISKLAHWRILPMLPDLTGYSWKDMGTVTSLRFRAARSLKQPDRRLFHNAEAAQVALDCILKMCPLSEPRSERLAIFENSFQIDPGEAILIALTLDDSQGCLLTGDKRALKAVSEIVSVGELLVGRVLVLEQIFIMALKKMGRSWILENVCPSSDIDKAINIVLGSRCDAEEKMIELGIASYLQEIEQYQNPSLLKHGVGV